jgi:hypothetical protein
MTSPAGVPNACSRGAVTTLNGDRTSARAASDAGSSAVALTPRLPASAASALPEPKTPWATRPAKTNGASCYASVTRNLRDFKGPPVPVIDSATALALVLAEE